jgi:hypothetical protein
MALTIPNVFANTQTIDAARFNSNFSAIATWANITDTSLAANAADIITAEALATAQGKGAFFAYKATAQTVSNVGYTTLEVLDTGTNAFDTNSYFSAYIYTPQVAGAYQFNVVVQALHATNFDDTSDTIDIWIMKNSSSNMIPLMTLVGDLSHHGSASIILKANGTTDNFRLLAQSNRTNTISYTYFSGVCVKPD